jgi:phage-related protein
MVESAAKWLASVANAFTNLSPEAQRMITIVLGITAAVGPLLIILGKFASAITAIKTLMAGTALANPWFLLAAAVVAVAALIIANWDKIKAWVMPILLAIKDVALAVWDAIKGAALAVADAFVAAWNWIKEAVMTVWGVIKGIAQAYIAVYVAAFKVVAGVFKVAWAVISAIVKAVWAVIRGIAKAYFALWRGVFTVVKTVALTVWNAIKGAVAAAWAVIRGIAVALKAFWVGVFNGIRTVASSVWQAIAGFFGTLWDRLRGIGTNIKQFFIDVWNTVKAKASGIWDAITEAFRGAINAIIGLWNRLDFSIDFTLPDVKYVPGLDGQHISTPDLIPDIPYLAKGGRIIAAGLAVVGERGPELVGLSAGATVAPVGAGGGGGPMRIELNLDRRRYGRAMELTFLSGRRG